MAVPSRVIALSIASLQFAAGASVSDCGSCPGGCIFANDVCYKVTESYCMQWTTNIWCGSTASTTMPTTAGATTAANTPSTTTIPETTSIPQATTFLATTTTIAPAPMTTQSACASCSGGCIFSNGLCYQVTESYCKSWATNTWCGGAGTSGQQTSTKAPTAPPATTTASAAAPSTVIPTTTNPTTLIGTTNPTLPPSTAAPTQPATTTSQATTFPPSTAAPTQPATTTAQATTFPLTTAAPTQPATTSVPPTGLVANVLGNLSAASSAGVFKYELPSGAWADSDIYTWPDMVEAVGMMATKGVGSLLLWLGGDVKYALVNVAAFLAQCMQETIRYNACDENNWSDRSVVSQVGGSTYSAASACGQMSQSYQDYTCSAEEDALAGGRMACDVDPNMEMRANTQAKWYGAPAKLFCAPRSKVPHAPRWDYTSPWCPSAGGWGYVPPFPSNVSLDQYFHYVNTGGSCKDYQGIQTGGWTFSGEGCVNGACPGSPAPLFGRPQGRTDVEGCCWWGRGVIQTTGVCNFGKLNYYMGKRAADEGRDALFPTVDFCKNPGAICEPGAPPALKWIAGFFYWLNAVQPYNQGGWVFKDQLKSWVDRGMHTGDTSFIDGVSGIVNRGCHNPPNCGTGPLDAGAKRAANFVTVLRAMGLPIQP